MKKCKLLAAFLAAALAVSSIPCAAFAETVSDIDLPALESIETNPTDSGDHATGGVTEFVFEEISAEEAAKLDAIIDSYEQQKSDENEVDFEYQAAVSDYFSYDYSNNYIYNQMDADQKECYDSLYEWAYEAATTTMDYQVNFVDKNLQYSVFARINYAEYGLDFGYASDVFTAFCLTNPQFFFLSPYVRYQNGCVYLYVWGDYCDGEVRSAAINSIAEQTAPYVNKINSAKSLMEKEEAVYDIVCQNLTYDHTSLAEQKSGNDATLPYTQTIAGMYFKNTTVCAGYAATFNYLCNLTGIETIEVVCWAGGHQWNMVNLYGNWYVIDTTGTWMDKDEEGYDYNFCNKSLAYIQSLSDQSRKAHTPDTYSGISLPDCNKNDYYIYLSASQDNDNYLGSLTSILDNYEDDYNWIWDYYVEGAPIHATSYGVYGYSPVGWNLYEWNPSTSEWYYTETVYGEQLNLTANKHISAIAIYQAIDETAVSNFVERLYTKMLNRSSEAAGKADWVSKIMNGATATDVASGFVLSEELKNQNLSNAEFVTRMYRTFMDRDPDEGGLANWVNALDNGCSYAYVLNSFVLSAEFGNICKSTGINTGSYELTEARDKNRNLTAFVSRMYTKALGRAYEVEGLNYWTGRVFSGDATLNALAHGFIFSGEFKNKNLSDSAFVDTLYVTFFDRPADATGKADWLNRMHYQGYTREQVLDGFLGAEEFGNLVKSFGL